MTGLFVQEKEKGGVGVGGHGGIKSRNKVQG